MRCGGEVAPEARSTRLASNFGASAAHLMQLHVARQRIPRTISRRRAKAGGNVLAIKRPFTRRTAVSVDVSGGRDRQTLGCSSAPGVVYGVHGSRKSTTGEYPKHREQARLRVCQGRMSFSCAARKRPLVIHAFHMKVWQEAWLNGPLPGSRRIHLRGIHRLPPSFGDYFRGTRWRERCGEKVETMSSVAADT